MRKCIGMILACLGVMFVLSGCQKDYYGYGKPFEMSTSKLPGYYNEDIKNISADNYERFMHASYIQVMDKYGNMQKIKISANIKRHNWDFENLDSSGLFKNYIDDQGPRKVGIDVSEHQGVIDWQAVAPNVDFAIIRMGYRGYTSGGIVMDAYYNTNMEQATANGIPVGIYFYSQATSYEEGVEEANYVLNNYGDYGLAYPIVLDCEDPMQEDARTNDMSVEQHTQAALGFIDTIKASGHRVMIYTNRMYFALYLNLDEIYPCPIWFAQYADEPDWPYEFEMWQYTEGGTIPGINGTVDMNLQMKEIQ